MTAPVVEWLRPLIVRAVNDSSSLWVGVLLSRQDYFTHFELSQLLGWAKMGDPLLNPNQKKKKKKEE